MSGYLFTLLIVLIGGGFVLGIIYIASEAEARKEKHKKNEADLHKEIREVKQRLAALEKIVTDKKFQLHEEINNL